jgi:hypothetical protein
MRIAALALLLSACAVPKPVGYEGVDAGYLVVALGEVPGVRYERYTIFFARMGEKATCTDYEDPNTGFKSQRCRRAGGGAASFMAQHSPLISEPPDDFEGAEHGRVLVQPLKPGNYEFDNVSIFRNGYPVQWTFHARENFSLPFTIKPGVATYVGDFEAHGFNSGTFMLLPKPGGAYFVVTDKSARDAPIARSRLPPGTRIDVAIPTLDQRIFVAQPLRGDPPADAFTSTTDTASLPAVKK